MTVTTTRRVAAGTLLPGFAGTVLPAWLAERLRNGLAGVCIFGDNISSRAQLRELTDQVRAANPDALIAIDEEGGDVTRLYYDRGSPYPGNAILGRLDDVAYTEALARLVGWELRLAGCNLNFAPDIDINSNPDNPVIGVRSFGADAELVSRHAGAWTRGLQSAGVASSPKHFPGHGDTAQDSHLGLPVIERDLDQLRERELLPFRAVIAAGAHTIMTSHILLPRLDPSGPATFSRLILQTLLREELGFDGVIVSDALDMRGASGELGIPEAAVRAVAAGCDLLCIGTDNTDAQLQQIEDGLLAAVTAGRLDGDRLSNAANRVRALARTLAQESNNIPIPEYVTADDEPGFDAGRIASAFDVQPGVRLLSDSVLIGVETTANIAVGVSPWGLRAAGAELFWVREGEEHALPIGLTPSAQYVIVGKDNHRHEWVRAFIDDVRLRHPSVIVVDMGWPSDDRRYADIATFGASRLAGRALLTLLDSMEVAR